MIIRILWFTQLCSALPSLRNGTLFSQSSHPSGGGIVASRGTVFSRCSVTCCRKRGLRRSMSVVTRSTAWWKYEELSGRTCSAHPSVCSVCEAARSAVMGPVLKVATMWVVLPRLGALFACAAGAVAWRRGIRSLARRRVSKNGENGCLRIAHFVLSFMLPASEAPSRSPRLYAEFIIGL